MPSARRTMPQTATPQPIEQASGGEARCICRTNSASGATTAAGGSSPRARTVSRRSSTTPPSPIRAAVSRSTPIDRAYTNTRSDCGRTTSDGRPARPVSRGSSSLTSPTEVRSAVSAPMVDRFSPSAMVSSARDNAPRTCTCRSSAPRFCRRISS